MCCHDEAVAAKDHDLKPFMPLTAAASGDGVDRRAVP